METVVLTMEYPLVVYTSALRDDIGISRKHISSLGADRKWDSLLEKIRSDSSLVNTCRLPENKDSPVDLNTPLHWAAIGSAPSDVFENLIALNSARSLKNADGKTPYDIAKENGLGDSIEDMLELPQKVKENTKYMDKMEKGLKKAIEGRVADLIEKNGQQLPQLAFLYEFGELWYAVPGMYGGFSVEEHAKGVQASSWCRVAGGSGQRHVIDRDGNVELVEEGFV
ncbi:hypothetical protein MAR_015550 [Mya arenaria]|uniref:Uncharacterized protein n=2 Tax=Mya arenaria TaxID=6604 RepID=A0ABY7FLG9_MYAAR|nr:hypothetical protein MAR_015550 [Mya arenaria]